MRGNQTLRGGSLGPRFLSMSPAKCSASNRAIQVSTVGRDTCKKAADTERVPALIIALHDLEPRVVAIGMRMVGPQLQLGLCGHRTLVPQEFRGLVIQGIG